MGVQTHFDKFHGRIKLGREDGAYKTARERDDSIKKDVMDAFKKEGISDCRKLHPGFAEDQYGDQTDQRGLRC